MSDTLVCHLHPTRHAKRRCYQCGRPACRSCQSRARGHIFCSSACDQAQAAAERTERLRRLAANPLRGKRWRVAVWGALVAGAGALAWVAAVLPARLVPDPVAERGQIAAVKPKPPDMRTGVEIAIEEPARTTAVEAQRAAISGRAPAGTMVGLYVEGEPVSAVYSADGTWSLGVELPERVNVIQARYFDGFGRSGYSPAVKLLVTGRLRERAQAGEQPTLEDGGHDLTRGTRDLKRVLLTFDGGSEDREAPRIFEILRKEKVRATIFLTGEFITRFPELVRQALADGHEIGNHSWSHPHLTTYAFNGRQATLGGIDRAFLEDQLRRTADEYLRVTGKPMAPFWRAPFGEHNPEVRRWAAEAGFTHIGWTQGLDTLDWVADPASKLFMTPEQIRAKILARDQGLDGLNGGIVLMHLGTERNADVAVPAMLPGLIAELRARGYEFATVSETLINLQASAPGDK